MKPIFTQRSGKSLIISQLDEGLFSQEQELGPEIKSTYQGLKCTAQPKNWDEYFHADDAESPW